MSLAASHGATAADRQTAATAYSTVANELPAVRAMADSWRKGLAGLLAAVIGFSLIRGRSDLDQLSPGWAIAAGVMLIAVLLTGAVAAWLILGAAHGMPRSTPLFALRRDDGATGIAVTNHDLAMSALRTLRIGLLTASIAVAFLVGAVGLTWYGPAKAAPKVAITDLGGTSWCGTPKQIRDSVMFLETAAGTISVNLTNSQTLRAVDSCPTS